MISKTKINERMKGKRNSILVETIFLAKKNNLLLLAQKLSGSTRKQSKVNLSQLNNVKGDKVIVVGKVLGSGEIKKKINISALGFSEQAKEKLKKAGCEIKSIKEDIEKNPKLTGVEII